MQNATEDLSPLEDLAELEELYLMSNAIRDIGPLVANGGLGEGDYVDLQKNPLEQPGACPDILALRARGVEGGVVRHLSERG